MARRRSRVRRRGIRVQRENAWAIGLENNSFEYTSVGGKTLEDQSTVLVRFNDLSPGEATLSRERSEWVVKRMILNVVWFGIRDVALSTPVRFVEWMLGVFDEGRLPEIELGAAQSVVQTDVYNDAQRVLQTGVNTTYDVWTPRTVLPGTDLAVDTGNAGAANHLGSGLPFNNAMLSLDLKANFRLREDAALIFAHGPGFGAELWSTDDQMDVLIDYKILAQRKDLK